MWALALAVLSVTALQVTGLKSALDLRGQNFNQNVERSLNQVAEWIQVSADINFLDHDTENQVNLNEPLHRESKSIVLRMESTNIDSLLHLALEKNGVQARGVFGAFDSYDQPVYLDRRVKNFAMN